MRCSSCLSNAAADHTRNYTTHMLFMHADVWDTWGTPWLTLGWCSVVSGLCFFLVLVFMTMEEELDKHVVDGVIVGLSMPDIVLSDVALQVLPIRLSAWLCGDGIKRDMSSGNWLVICWRCWNKNSNSSNSKSKVRCPSLSQLLVYYTLVGKFWMFFLIMFQKCNYILGTLGGSFLGDNVVQEWGRFLKSTRGKIDVYIQNAWAHFRGSKISKGFARWCISWNRSIDSIYWFQGHQWILRSWLCASVCEALTTSGAWTMHQAHQKCR